MKPGKRVSGMRNRKPGLTRWKMLSSPAAARTRPRTTIQVGRSFLNAAVTETPAMSRPMGTEKPGPPERERKVVERQQSGWVLHHGGLDHGPGGEACGEAVEDGEKASEERDMKRPRRGYRENEAG